MTNEDEQARLRHELAQNGVDIGTFHAYARATGTVTAKTDAMLTDLAERNALAMQAAGQQMSPEEFRRQVALRRARERMAALKKKRRPVRDAKKDQPAKALLGDRAAVPDRPARTKQSDAPPGVGKPTRSATTRVVRR